MQCLSHKRLIYEAMFTLRNLETYFAAHLQHHIQYRPFLKNFNKKVCIIMGTFVLSVVPFVLQYMFYHRMDPVILQIKVLQTLTAVTTLHIVFHIDALGFHLGQLNAVIFRDIKDIQSESSVCLVRLFTPKKPTNFILIRNKMQCYKTVHFRLWEVAQKLNQFFGWTLVALLLQSFFDFVYTVYWQIGQLRRNFLLIKVIRKKCYWNNLCSFLLFIWNFIHFNWYIFSFRPIIQFGQYCNEYYNIGELLLCTYRRSRFSFFLLFYFKFMVYSFNVYLSQKTHLVDNLEKFNFSASFHLGLHNAKQEVFMQLSKLDISVQAKGFFDIDRRFIAAVCVLLGLYFLWIYFSNRNFLIFLFL